MAAECSSLVVTGNCLPQMPEHSEVIITTLTNISHDLAELVVSSSSSYNMYRPVHLECTNKLMVPIQQTTFAIGQLVIGKSFK